MASIPADLLASTRLSACRTVSRLGGLIIVCVGLAVLVLGWGCGVEFMKSLVSGYPAMKPNTALGLLLCGLALCLDPPWPKLDPLGPNMDRSRRVRSWGVATCAGIAGLIGLLTLLEYVPGNPLNIDHLLFAHRVMQTARERMSPVAALELALFGSVLLLFQHRRGFAFGQALSLLVAFLALFNLLASLYGIRVFTGVAFDANSTTMAIHTSISFLVLSVGILLSQPDSGFLSAVNSSAPGGVMARRLLPAAILIPAITGWLRWQGQLWGLYDTAFGLTLSTLINIAIFTFLIWKSGQILNSLDVERARAERNMRQLADSMPQIVWTTDAAGEINYYNLRCYEYIGGSFEQARGGGWVAAIHPDEVGEIMLRRTRAFAAREPYTLEYRFRRASDGMYRWHLARGIPIFDSRGELLNWIGTCTDVHEVKVAEDAARRSEASFRQLADSMPQVIWTAVRDGAFDYYNQRWYDYTGLTAQQSRAGGWELVVHPSDRQRVADVWARAVASGSAYELECRLKRASDNAYRWHLCRACPGRDSQGQVIRWFGSCTDIEEQKRISIEIRILNESLERRVRERTAELARTVDQLALANMELKDFSLRLEQSNNELQDFASIASHDLQEPLRKVQAFGDRLKTSSHDAIGEQGRDYLDRMLNATKRMSSLIHDLLSFARVSSHGRSFSRVNLAQLAREVLSDLEVAIGETNAVIEIAELPAIDADPMQMRQLLQNLIGNAIKFHQTEKPPSVKVYAETAAPAHTGNGDPPAGCGPDDKLRLVVKDEGIGFDEKYLDRIFTVFQRLHGQADYAGTGVGLAICRKIAQRHGGEITATSTPGQGSCFLVVLPMRHRPGNNLRISAADADKTFETISRH